MGPRRVTDLDPPARHRDLMTPSTLARRTLIVGSSLAVVVAVGCIATAVATAPLPDGVPSSPGPLERVGVIHVHTVASDGGGTLEEMVDAAEGLDLDFVVLTDHNTRGAADWGYYDSTLVLVGEEVNTPYGHLLAVGRTAVGNRRDLPLDPADGETPTRLPVAVAPEEGLRIAAHPSGRTRWKAWEPGHFDGMEIWNADSERRNDGLGEWIHAVGLLPFRRMAALYRLLDYPRGNLALWDRLLDTRRVFGVCSVDAHHTLPLNRRRTLDLHFPAYRHSFRLARQHVLLETPPEGRAITDGTALLEAIRRGRSFCAFDGLADARGATFTIHANGARGTLGETVAWTRDARLEVSLPPAAESGRVRLIRNGEVVDSTSNRRAWSVTLPGPGVYRVEAFLQLGRRSVPWILTNPMWLEDRRPPAPG